MLHLYVIRHMTAWHGLANMRSTTIRQMKLPLKKDFAQIYRFMIELFLRFTAQLRLFTMRNRGFNLRASYDYFL